MLNIWIPKGRNNKQGKYYNNNNKIAYAKSASKLVQRHS